MARPQFSVRLIFAATAVFALIIAEETFSLFVAGYVGFFGTFAACSLAAVAAVQGEGSIRAFAIGTLPVLAAMIACLMGHDYFMDILRDVGNPGVPGRWSGLGVFFRRSFVVGWLMSIVLGTICVGFRWLIAPREDKR